MVASSSPSEEPAIADVEVVRSEIEGSLDSSGNDGTHIPFPDVDSDMNDTANVDCGSSMSEAIFNFTNSIIGAGAIGLGGAMAVSGGLISVVLILFFGYLTKLSLDMVIRLSIETPGTRCSYEDLAQVALGKLGRLIVMACKLTYSFGCLVAYIVVIKENLADGIRHLVYGAIDVRHEGDLLYTILSDRSMFTWFVGLVLILPLCLLRDVTPLARFSILSILSMVAIVGIVMYMYFFCPSIGLSGGSMFMKWLEVRSGVFESLGTFLFTFVSQHTVHLIFASLKPSLKTLSTWKWVSSLAIGCASFVSLSVGLFVYMTFWQATKSNIFEIYPESLLIDLAKILLCLNMVLTFPLPFFTCRELLIVTFIHPFCGINHTQTERISSFTSPVEDSSDLEEPLLEGTNNADIDSGQTTTPVVKWLLPEDDRQLKFLGHVVLTIKLWAVVTALAIAAPSLGDVLNLVGCASGTVIAFLLPAILSFKIEGYSHVAMLIFFVGSTVGTVGTFFSLKRLLIDLKL